jgi:hypothetical protein
VVVEVAEAEEAAVEAGAGEGFGASPEAASLDAIFSSKIDCCARYVWRAVGISALVGLVVVWEKWKETRS